MKKEIKILVIAVVFILTAAIITIFWYGEIYGFGPQSYQSINPQIEFEEDLIDKTLTVVNLDMDLDWENITISSGYATLPSGTINVGNVITNCSGHVALIYEHTNTLLYTGDFT